jgi:DNA-entry nuclease
VKRFLALLLSVLTTLSLTSCAVPAEVSDALSDTYIGKFLDPEFDWEDQGTQATDSDADSEDSSIPVTVIDTSDEAEKETAGSTTTYAVDFSELWFEGEPYIVINDNEPYFTEADMELGEFVTCSELDDLGRCGVAFGLAGPDTLATGERPDISSIKPTGWHSVQYDCISTMWLFNRSHLLMRAAFASCEADPRNLITGTRYMNVEGMLPFEDMMLDYVKETGNHVLYRVTPIFIDDELLCRGVEMEAKSVEDDGDGILYNVFCYNAQPYIRLDYATGDSEQIDEEYEVHTTVLELENAA